MYPVWVPYNNMCIARISNDEEDDGRRREKERGIIGCAKAYHYVNPYS
jgi:hypothetical protein